MQGVKISHIRNPALSALSAILLSLSFPGYDIEVLAWIGLLPLFSLIKGGSTRNAFLWCWTSGTLFFFITINWVIKTMNNYGGIPLWVSLLILLLLSLYLGLYFGVFGLLTRYVTTKARLPLPCAAPLLWVSLEYVRAHLLTGFPWASLGYSQYRFLHLIQIADITSVLGVSFLVVAVNAALFEILSKGRRRKIISVSAVAFLFLLSLAYGYYRLNRSYDNTERELSVAVLQGNIPQNLKWDRAFQRRTIDIYARLTAESHQHQAHLVIWPETAAPLFFQDPSTYRQELFDLAKEENVFLLFGSPSYTVGADATLKLFNSAYLISPNGESLSRYDKRHLVPFGEYIPLSKILFFIEKMVAGIGDFVPGNDYTLFQIPQAKFGVVICFEVVFPDLVRHFVLNGAEFMATITNDAWFGRSAAPYQHFAMVVFRAIENRVYFARAANTGISGFISPKGETLKASPLFVENALLRTISPSTTRTIYTAYGDIFAYVSIFITGIVMIVAVFFRPSNS
jgi:apolipoprotein N-acyltransferase